ncbi:YybH family protein [Planobispora siamensis]|uniref:SnoaL-like domain-containing protein n=1 Tax=Planobispora siamensis TaxID=936338 RepID=A0A8J3WND8_9ACTN|nr:nuclear transport factor 2 family protein [Planobispora siamensis]GIH95720.1 hypothetical protein Psi01_63500 [Planobispora siamensis]
MTENLIRTLCLAAVLAALTTACSAGTEAGPTASGPAASAAPARDATPSVPVRDTVPAEHRALVDRFVEAINAGDAGRVAAVFAPEASFDSVGRIYEGREQIMDRFLVPEVIEARGRYTLLSVAPGAGGRVVAEYDFATGHGGREHFTYDCSVRERRFADCVGRYV